MVVEREARGSDGLQHRVAQPLPVIDLVRIRRLEQKAAQVDHLHEQAVASLDRVIVDMARIGQMLTRRALARDGIAPAVQAR